MKLSRRGVLGAAAASAFFPWLSALGAGPTRKLLLFYTPHGTVFEKWRPTGGETGFVMSEILQPIEQAGHRPRVSIVDGVSLPHGAPYDIPHTFSMPALWTGSPIETSSTLFSRPDYPNRSFGWGTGVSVDQAIAQRLQVKTLELGTYCGEVHPKSRMIYAAPGKVLNPIDDPRAAFNTLFGAAAPTSPEAIEAKLRRKNVLDAVRADMNARKAGLSSSDRARLDSHATAVEELQAKLLADGPACPRPGAPADITTQTAMDRQSSLAARALGCGLARIVSLQMRHADIDGSTYPWVGLTTRGHHNYTHDSSADAQDQLARVYNWYAGRFAHLLTELANTDDAGGGKVLDNTLVIWGSELGRGWDHNRSNVPFVFAGGPVRGDRYLKVSNLTHHRVLVTAFHAMGLTEVQQHGSVDRGAGPVPGVLR